MISVGVAETRLRSPFKRNEQDAVSKCFLLLLFFSHVLKQHLGSTLSDCTASPLFSIGKQLHGGVFSRACPQNTAGFTLIQHPTDWWLGLVTWWLKASIQTTN